MTKSASSTASKSSKSSSSTVTDTEDLPRPIRKVLIANRGEIAVRIIRAAQDSGIETVAVYADSDIDSMPVKLADEAYSLDGVTAGQTYLEGKKIIRIALDSGADAIHPGYGFLSENPQFARDVHDAGLTWIGPNPESIEQLGDKVQARQLAEKIGAPLVPGTKNPVKNAREVKRFANKHGLPIAIKAAYGGGGRGIKVVRDGDDIQEAYESAVREAEAAFGDGACFVERFLENPRHVETQCLADSHGNVVVVSTRDCSLQRRNQKLVEEAPAPYLTKRQSKELTESSKKLLKAAHYQSAGTCEFLIGHDGTISFLEVNTRLQVEHPVSEEVTGIDLVREQFRIAEGQALGYSDPPVTGHSFEFRINGEDPGRGFLPQTGIVTDLNYPLGPGVRIDSGVQSSDEITGNFDSMLAKLIVTGATRQQALERAHRALNEFSVDGLPTVLPFHREVIKLKDFAPELYDQEGPFSVNTRWIESDFDNQIPPFADSSSVSGSSVDHEKYTLEINGKRVEVKIPEKLLHSSPAAETSKVTPKKAKKNMRSQETEPANENTVTSPMQGTIVKVAAENGQKVSKGDLIVVLEAMKMEQPLTTHKDGTVVDIDMKVGQTVPSGTVLARIED